MSSTVPGPHIGPGRPVDDVLAEMESMRTRDVRWRDGRAFTLAYNAGPEAVALAEEAYRRFSGENALNTDAFPSLRRMQKESSDGFMSSG